MRNFVIFTAAVLSLAGCGSDTKQSANADTAAGVKPEVIAEAPPVAPKPTHYYAMQDGQKYGYERAISQEERNQGRAASELVMVSYAGEHDGKHQLFISEKFGKAVFECDTDCKYIKSMVFVQNEHIKTDYLKAGADSVAGAAMVDAINGQLNRATVSRKSDRSKKYHVWFTEDKGMELTPVNQE